MAAKSADKAIEQMTVAQAMDFRATAIAKGVSRRQIQSNSAKLALVLDAIKEGARIQILPALNILWTLVSDGRTAEQFIEALEKLGNTVGNWAKDIMSKEQFVQEITSGVTYKLVGIRGDEFTDEQRTTENIFAEAARRGYRKPPAFLAALLREKFTQGQFGYPYVAVMHEPICDSDRYPFVLALYRIDERDWLSAWLAYPENRWIREYLFVFLAPQEPSELVA